MFSLQGAQVWYLVRELGPTLLFNRPVMSDSLWLHELQHARPLCPSPSHKVCPSLCPFHQGCHPAISFSDTLFSFCPQSFQASGTFHSQLFTSNEQTIEVSTSASVLPTSIQGEFPLRLTGLILLSKRFSGVFSSTTVWRHQFFGAPPSLQSISHRWLRTQLCSCESELTKEISVGY